MVVNQVFRLERVDVPVERRLAHRLVHCRDIDVVLKPEHVDGPAGAGLVETDMLNEVEHGDVVRDVVLDDLSGAPERVTPLVHHIRRVTGGVPFRFGQDLAVGEHLAVRRYGDVTGCVGNLRAQFVHVERHHRRVDRLAQSAEIRRQRRYVGLRQLRHGVALADVIIAADVEHRLILLDILDRRADSLGLRGGVSGVERLAQIHIVRYRIVEIKDIVDLLDVWITLERGQR